MTARPFSYSGTTAAISASISPAPRIGGARMKNFANGFILVKNPLSFC